MISEFDNSIAIVKFKEKEIDEEDIKIIPRSNPLLQEFNNDRFSDITIVGLGKSLKLHKLILVQSPFFHNKILNEDVDLVFIELSDWPTVTKLGIEVCFNQSTLF